MRWQSAIGDTTGIELTVGEGRRGGAIQRKPEELYIPHVSMADTSETTTQTQFLCDFHMLARTEGHYGKIYLLRLAQTVNGRVEEGIPMPEEYMFVVRRRFNKIFYGRWPLPNVCWACGNALVKGGVARHHIIALSKWGNNRHLNIVHLCFSCHASVHPWLQEAGKAYVPFL